jgi:hypothetical protein
MDSKKQKIKTFHAILVRLGMLSHKESLLAGYGVESTLELEESEIDELIDYLKRHERSQKKEHDSQLRQLRSIVLTILQRMGIYSNNNDWHRVNKYLLQSRIAGKLLYQLNTDELRSLIKKLRGIERKESEKAAMEEYQAINN